MSLKSTLSKYFNERVMQSPQYPVLALGGIIGATASLTHNSVSGAALGLILAIAGGYCWRNEANKQSPNPKP